MQEYIDFVVRHPILFSLFGIILTLIIVGEMRRKASGAKPVTSVAATQLINGGKCIVVDVRPKADYSKGHIVDAQHMNFSDVKEQGGRLSEDKDTPILVYCRNGTQAPSAANLLKQAGFNHVYMLAGGLLAWEADSMPLEK